MNEKCSICKNIVNDIKFSIDRHYTKHSNILLRTILESVFGKRIVLTFNLQICAICNDLLNDLDLAESTCKRIRQKILTYFDLKYFIAKTNVYSQTDVFLENVLEYDVHGNKSANDQNTTDSSNLSNNHDKVKNKKNKLLNIDFKKFECHICFRKFSAKSGLTLHINRLHSMVSREINVELEKGANEKHSDFKLNENSSSEFKREGLEQEQSSVNPDKEDKANNSVENNVDKGDIKKNSLGLKPYKCSQCCKTWKTLGELKSHLSAHSNARPFICEICGQAYKQKTALDIHVGMHNGINPFVCTYCNKSFTQKGALQRHLPIHTGETPYQCDLCGKRFIHHTSFNVHQLSHSGQKDYKCVLCGLALLSGSHLKRHMRVHTGERNYTCPTCGKRFAERYNLVSHQKLHDSSSSNVSSKRSHRCQVCGATYNRKLKLDEHMARNHQKITETDVPFIQHLFTKTETSWIPYNGIKETVQSSC